MKYERLTKRDNNGKACYIKNPQSSYIQTMLEEQTEIEKEGLNRLCDLETKIENGTLVELPCKVGDKFYYVHGKRVYENQVFELCTTGTRWGFYDIYGIWFLASTVFFTREEAEKRLKGLGNESSND